MSFKLSDIQADALGLKERISLWLDDNNMEHDGLRALADDMCHLLYECEWLLQHEGKQEHR